MHGYSLQNFNCFELLTYKLVTSKVIAELRTERLETE